jgi:3-deoxy-D-manno-octulosonic-acid transferase
LKLWRGLYSAVTVAMLPLFVLRLLVKSRRHAGYRQRILERFARHQLSAKGQPTLWLHAVSVGEVVASGPLVKAMIQRFDVDIVVTTATPTGSAQVQRVFGDSVKHCYVPFDVSCFIRRFIRQMNVCAMVMMETEIWPNMLAIAKQHAIPCFLVNARLSERSCARYARFPRVSRWMVSNFSHILARHSHDVERFCRLGAEIENCSVAGNIKFDCAVDAIQVEKGLALRREYLAGRPVWIAASTHRGEELLIVQAHQQVLQQFPDAVLILVPRHPERFAEVYALCVNAGLQTAQRSQQQAIVTTTQVYLGDTMGELVALYAASDVVFVGGSLVPVGGHNFLEPAALSKPLLSGHELYNFQVIADQLKAVKALQRVTNVGQLAQQVSTLLADEAAQLAAGAAAYAVVQANRGAVSKVIDCIAAHLAEAAS